MPHHAAEVLPCGSPLELDMFGTRGSTSPQVAEWLEKLRNAEPDSQRGVLVARNLECDSNVPTPIKEEFENAVASEAEPTFPDEAAAVYQRVLHHLHKRGLGFDSSANEPNRLGGTGFDSFCRVADLRSFCLHNLQAVTKNRAEDSRFREQIARRLRGTECPRLVPVMLQGQVGDDRVWATREEAVHDSTGRHRDQDELRDALGLDDPDRFGPGDRMIVYFYPRNRIPDSKCWRPTVLDAGWHPTSGAFLPSGSRADTGMTQDLRSGDASEPEVLHRPFRANIVGSVMATDPLRTRPSTEYRAVRLGVQRGSP